MVRNDISLEFDITRAQTLADAHGWDLREWSWRADVSLPTLRSWLRGDPRIKIRTVNEILRPLGLTAGELLKK